MTRQRPLILWVFNYMEIWRLINDYPNYEVSNLGRVKSMKFEKERILKPELLKDGYLRVKIYNDVKKNKFLVHRLVADCFIENKEKKKQINHKNGIKTDNSVSNIEWVTPSENMTHSYILKLNYSKLGEEHPMSKLTKKDVINIRKKKYSIKKEAEFYNVCIGTINKIRAKTIWKHI